MRSRVSHVTGRCTAETRGSDAGRPFACAWITMVHDKIRRACFHAENGTVPVAEYRGMYRETFMTLLTSPMMHRSVAFFSSNSSLLSRESKSLRRSSEKRSESSSGFEKFEDHVVEGIPKECAEFAKLPTVLLILTILRNYFSVPLSPRSSRTTLFFREQVKVSKDSAGCA